MSQKRPAQIFLVPTDYFFFSAGPAAVSSGDSTSSLSILNQPVKQRSRFNSIKQSSLSTTLRRLLTVDVSTDGALH